MGVFSRKLSEKNSRTGRCAVRRGEAGGAGASDDEVVAMLSHSSRQSSIALTTWPKFSNRSSGFAATSRAINPRNAGGHSAGKSGS